MIDAMRKLDLDKWLFVLSLSVLGAVFIWNLTDKPDATRAPPPAPFRQPPRVDIIPIENSLYTLEELEYFQDIAFNSEHKDLPPRIRKWTSNINVRLEGDLTGEDLLAVKQTIDEINELQNAVTLSVGYFDSNMVVRFAPEATFKKWHGNYPAKNLGYFWVRWVDEEIYAANVLIDTSETSQADRNGLIKEEITQAMGLMSVSNRYNDSIFNDDTDVYRNLLSPLDKKLLQMLYRPEISPSMDPEQALGLLSQLTRDGDQ